ncbi:MAG: hypothetical protein KH453_12800, partial [[Eubacterium] siraeum]|nr:hypothetical protein [[Eubacterium] siraeum]
TAKFSRNYRIQPQNLAEIIEYNRKKTLSLLQTTNKKYIIMGTIKTQCSCGMLWLSETLGGYDTICDHDGKICSAVNYQDGQFKIIQPEECKRHKRDIMEEFKGALQQVKDHMDGKIQLKSAEALLDELRQEQHL